MSWGDVVAAEDSLVPAEVRMSVVAFSTSFSSACSESYEPSWIRVVMVTAPPGGVSFVRFESASP